MCFLKNKCQKICIYQIIFVPLHLLNIIKNIINNMNKEQIKEFLNRLPGYRKEGSRRLQKKLLREGLDVTQEECKEALREFKSTYKNKDDITREILSKEALKPPVNENLVLNSKWQSAGGKWLSSYKAKKTDVYDEFLALKDDLIKELQNISPPSIKEIKKSTKGNILYEISLPDFHFGKDYGKTIEEQILIYLEGIEALVEKAKGLNISRFLLPIGNDLFNSDNLLYTTTKGTQQRDISQWQTSFKAGTLAVIKSINYLLQFAPVDVIVVQGNHDYQKSFYLGEVVDAFFTNNKKVNVDNNVNSPRKYYKYGKCLLGFTHGDKEKVADLPLIMAVEQPIAFSETIYKEWHIGHLHKHIHDEFQGISVKMLPSLTGQDEWHKQMGYNSNRRAQAYIWNFATGLEGFLQINR